MQSVAKKALRREIRRLKQQYTPSQLEELSEPIIARLRPLLSDARVVMAYYSLPDEVNTHQLLDDLVAEGKTVLLPKVLDATTMELRHYTGPHDLAPGPFGILEPTGPHYSPSSLLTPPSSNLHAFAFSGIHSFSPRLFPLMDRFPDRFSIIDFYLSVCHRSHIVGLVKPDLNVLDVGKLDSLDAAEHFVSFTI